MKNLTYVLLLGLFIYSCSSTKNTGNDMVQNSEVKGDTIRIANDSLEYEVIIIEPGFDTWLITHAEPRSMYTQSFLEAKLRPMIITYNQRANNPLQYGQIYPHPINYEFDEDYGFEVNYMLYNYLLFFQKKYDQRL